MYPIRKNKSEVSSVIEWTWSWTNNM